MPCTHQSSDPQSQSKPSCDESLLRRWQDGDAEAGTDLLRRYESTLRRFFASRVAEPCDLIQQTFLVCTKNVDRIEDCSKFSGFLMGVARRVWLEHVRKSRVRTDRFAALSHEPSPEESSPMQVVSLLESGHSLTVAVEDLPPQWRQAVVQHYWQDRSVAEIAKGASVATGTVKSWLARARSALKRKLARSTKVTERMA